MPMSFISPTDVRSFLGKSDRISHLASQDDAKHVGLFSHKDAGCVSILIAVKFTLMDMMFSMGDCPSDLRNGGAIS